MTARQQQRQQQGGGFELGDYNDVSSRIAEFRTKHPEGSLQPVDPAKPYTIEQLGGETFLVVVAAAYRTPDDPRPGIGMAYEQFPGRTPYTRNSELQNAETSAWGRAIVAVLAADTRKGISSAEEVRNRRAENAEHAEQQDGRQVADDLMAKATKAIGDATDKAGLDKIGRYISSLVDSGKLTENDAITLRRALVARLDVLYPNANEPRSDDWDDPPITDATAKRLHTLFGKANIKDRDDKIRFAAEVVGRDIASTGELTMGEARQVMAAVEQAMGEPVGADT